MGRADGFRIGVFGDVRRQEAGSALFERVAETGSLVLRRVGGDRAGEMSAHRFLDSPHVTPEKILRTAANHTVAACAGRRVVATQVTTEINFLARSLGRRGLGPAGHDGKTPGCFCHAIVAVDVEDEVVLGVVHARIWTRPTAGPRSIEDKESFRWLWCDHA